MSECTIKTECANCIHKDICKLTDAYLEFIANMSEQRIRDSFDVNVSCKHYEQRGQYTIKGGF